jgi:hypothetical protein
MTTELASRRIVVSWLLPSLCLRYGIAKPSIWLCRKACKRRQFNDFGSDYPLNLTCFGFRYSSVVAKWHMRTFLALRSEGCNSVRKVSHSWSQSRGNIASPGTDVASVLLIRKHCRSSSSRGGPLGTSFPLPHAGHVPRTDTFSTRCCARTLPQPPPQGFAEQEHSRAPHCRTSGLSKSDSLSARSTDSTNPNYMPSGFVVCKKERGTMAILLCTQFALAINAGVVWAPQTTSPQGTERNPLCIKVEEQ